MTDIKLRVKECPREEAHTPHAWSTTSPDGQFFCPGTEAEK